MKFATVVRRRAIRSSSRHDAPPRFGPNFWQRRDLKPPRILVLTLMCALCSVGAAHPQDAQDWLTPHATQIPRPGPLPPVDPNVLKLAGPLILKVSPQKGAKGVHQWDPIIVTFSEPMDRASVQGAWTSASLPASDMLFSWNADSTVLTVNHMKPLEYSETGVGYSFRFVKGAKTQSGAALFSVNQSFKFRTLRRLTAGMWAQHAYSVLPYVVYLYNEPTLGTEYQDQFYRVFLEFNTSQLPKTFEVEKAEFISALAPVTDFATYKLRPWPFTVLGKLRVYSTSFEGLPTYDTPTGSYLGTLSTVSDDLSGVTSTGYEIRDLLADGNDSGFAVALRKDVSDPARNNRTQIRLQFEAGPNPVWYSQLRMSLSGVGLTYLVP